MFIYEHRGGFLEDLDSWQNLKAIGRSLNLDPRKPDIPLHGFEIAPATDFLNLDRRHSIPDELCCETRSQRMELDRGNQKADCTSLLKGLTGYTVAEQFFPRGYELYSGQQPKIQAPDKWSGKKAIVVLLLDTPVLAGMREALAKTISAVSGNPAKIEVISTAKLNERMKRGDFDILGVQIAVADPNFEGAMSFFIEKDPPFIPSGEGATDFSAQLRQARGLPTSAERAARMREIIIRAQEAGHVLPLFHFSSLAVAKPGVDLSEIPNSDETILFSKVRMR